MSSAPAKNWTTTMPTNLAGHLAQPDPAPVISPPALLQRIVMPRTTDPMDVRALYFDESPPPARIARGKHLRAVGAPARNARPLSRSSVHVRERSTVSFSAYFNAFPAGYWRRWTTITAIRLNLMLEGPGRVDVYRSRADGGRVHVRSAPFDAPGAHELNLILELGPFEDGGWYWFDVTTEDEPVVLHSGGWYALVPPPGRASVALGMPTFNRPADCVATLRAIAGDEMLREVVTALIIPDQGADKVCDQEGFGEVREVLGDRLRIVDQPNLGGSGGYARIMYEALTTTDCEQILFMDDDVQLEPDTILRALAFSRFARQPMLVGGQMLNLPARSQLHVMGEIVDRGGFGWRHHPDTDTDHDFAEQPLRHTPWLHKRVDVDYNAWWMCMIPRAVAERIGLPLPLFIKWDDVEYGLRAGAAGFPTVTVPGIAVWHMSFADKHDSLNWQEYFLTRNQLVVAALHGPPRPTRLLLESLKISLHRLLSMEYSTVALREMAVRDFLAGPETLFSKLETALPEVRKRGGEFEDTRMLWSAGDLPPAAARFAEPPRTAASEQRPANPALKLGGLVRGIVHNLTPVDPENQKRPQHNLNPAQARWTVLSALDTATVSSTDGRGVRLLRRDREQFWQLLATSLRLHFTLARRFPGLQRRYLASFKRLTAVERWKRVFEQ
ncbi:glycosyltransferase [Saccharopolyspora erythraea]|nr:glycosyltransferase [Saccharopolyspora erythraea]